LGYGGGLPTKLSSSFDGGAWFANRAPLAATGEQPQPGCIMTIEPAATCERISFSVYRSSRGLDSFQNDSWFSLELLEIVRFFLLLPTAVLHIDLMRTPEEPFGFHDCLFL
jgi:hypothetical protein